MGCADRYTHYPACFLSLCRAVTPEDYQPPGFKEADGNNLMFETEPVRLTMGEVMTPYHTLKLDMATERQRLEQVSVRVSLRSLACAPGRVGAHSLHVFTGFSFLQHE